MKSHQKKGFLQSKIVFAFCTTMFIVFGVLLQGCISRLENTSGSLRRNEILQGCISRLENARYGNRTRGQLQGCISRLEKLG